MGAVATRRCLGSSLWIFKVDKSCALRLATLIIKQFASDHVEICVFKDLGKHHLSEIWS